jgi:hypothetical protein
MSDFQRLFDACKDATGIEIKNMWDAHLVVEQLDTKCGTLERKIVRMETAMELKWFDKSIPENLPHEECNVIVNCMTPIGLRSEFRHYLPAEYNEDGEKIDEYSFNRDGCPMSWDNNFTHFIIFPEPI